MILLGFLAAILAAGCCWVVACLIADRLLRGTGVTVRLVGGLCVAYWLAAWVFEILALAGGFRLGVIMPLVVVVPLAGLLVRRDSVARTMGSLGADLRVEVQALFDDLRQHRWALAGLGLIGIHVLLRMVRTLATPSFGWDDFTYHLFRAGRWVQNGGIVLEPAPDAWTYYEFFPWGGDLLWAWALVWQVGDALVPVGAIGLWSLVLMAAYAVARELGQERTTSLIVATAIAVLPSQISQMSTAYVDNGVLAMVLVCSLFLLVYLKQEKTASAALLMGAAAGLGLLVKMSFLPLLAPAGVIVAWFALRRRRFVDLAAFAIGLSVAIPNLVFNWVQRGSPFYPFEVVGFLPFNEQHSWILNKYGEGATVPELIRAAKALVINESPIDPFLNVGFLGVVLLILGVIGSFKLTGTSRGRWFLFWAYSGGVITVLMFFSPKNSSMFALWTLVMGRLLVPSLAGLLVSSGLVGGRVVRAVILPLMLVEYLGYGRRKWPIEMTVAAIQILAIILAVGGVWFLWRRSRWRERPVWPVLAVASTIALLAITGVRERWRWDAYRLYSERALFDFHGVPPTMMWPIWERIDQAPPGLVVVTAGFDGQTGHNWFRWPFVGSMLQHEVVYVPVTAGGELVSYRDRETLIAASDHLAWMTRLADSHVDWVAALGPFNLEHQWVLDFPEIFPVEITMGNNNFLLARVDHAALAAYLSATR